MDPQTVQGILSLGISRNARACAFCGGASSVELWLLGLGALFLAGVFLSRATLLWLDTAQAAGDIEGKPRQRRERSIYRWVITILSVYFYISIPFLFLLWLLVVGSAYYAVFLNGSLPLKFSPAQAVILAVVLAVPLAVVLSSFFPGGQDPLPGRKLERKE